MRITKLRKKKNTIKEFENPNDTTKFILENYSLVSLPKETKTLIGSIQSHSLYQDNIHDNECINAIKEQFEYLSPIKFDLIAWRAGDMKCKNRPFVPATLLKEISKYYAYDKKRNIHKIILKKGAKILPLRALGKDYGDGEAEIIIDTSKLKKRFGYYIYK